MARYSKDERINAQVTELVREGWVVKYGGQHPKLTSPEGRSIGFSTTPSDFRNAMNWMTRLKRIKSK